MDWCTRNPKILFHNPPDVSTGEYGDTDCADEMLWAAAELWRTTGETEYQKAFVAAAGKPESIVIAAPSWSDLAAMAYWTYALAGRKDAIGLQSAIQQATIKAAESLAAK